MKKFWDRYGYVIRLVVAWRMALWIMVVVSSGWWQEQFDFLGVVPWANFDGAHYLGIATEGYRQYQQAFFPLYPILIRLLSFLAGVAPWIAGVALSHAALVAGVCCLYEFTLQFGEAVARRVVALLLAFPMSFFFAAVYSESLFFFLASATILMVHRQRFGAAGVYGLLASATRLFGVLLTVYMVLELYRSGKLAKHMLIYAAMIPMGLVLYSLYLYISVGDPLAFAHVQQYFGANRTGTALVWFPQVLWRYGKILSTVSPASHLYWVSLSELGMTLAALAVGVAGLRDRKLHPLMAYSLGVLIIPTLTGTFSSMGRYILGAFPLFIYLAQVPRRVRQGIMIVFVFGLVLASSLYLAGYFIA